jgi:uncharacterized membrane protein YjgN (DUF898 family)
MTTMDVAHPTSVPSVPAAASEPPDVGVARFHGSERRFLGLLVRGSLLLAVTLGIYRFWLATDVRRFLWGNTEIAGDYLEYSGTARELLLGFLMALALLVPVYALFFLAALDAGLVGTLSGVLAFLVLALLGQFAVYRARRYRLTRTIFRGVRLYQTGSAWRYAFTSALWWVLTIVTAGLALPWGTAVLERYKLRHTHYGTLQGSFAGTGTGLFLRGIALWLIVVGPLLAGALFALGAINWGALAAALTGSGDDLTKRLADVGFELAAAAVIASSALGWSVLAAALLYPVYRAIVLRWWISGLRLGAATATSRLGTGEVYRVYLRFIGYSILFGTLAVMLIGVALAAFGGLTPSFGKSATSEIAAAVLFIATYVFIMLGYSVVYQATVTIRFWRLSFETTEIKGLRTLDGVEARGAAGSPFGEGLADALDVGGL